MLKTLIIIILFLFSLGSKAQDRHTLFYNKIEGEIFNSIIPILHEASHESFKKTIENTKVRFLKMGNFNDAYAHDTDQGPEIVIGYSLLYFLYLQSLGHIGIYYIQNMNDYEGNASDSDSYQNYLFAHLREQIDKYNQREEIDSFPDTINEYLGISEVRYKNAIVANGGLELYDQILSQYFLGGIASILAHEYAHVHYRHIYNDGKLLTKYDQRKQEWLADQEGILLLANSVLELSGAILAHQVFTVIENPDIPTDHPSNICRVIYTYDAVIHFAKRDLKVLEFRGASKESLDNLEKSIEVLESNYVNMKKDKLISEICDDFVFLKY